MEERKMEFGIRPLGRRLLIAGAFAAAVFGMPITAVAAEKEDPHADLMAEESYPTAAQCGACHTQVYREWASSNHAYASISPMFHKF